MAPAAVSDTARSSLTAKPLVYERGLGEPSIASRFPPLEPIPFEVLEADAQKVRDTGPVPEVESRFGDLKAAVRRARTS